MTASAMTQDRQKIMAAGFDGYQAKPIDVTQFVAAVREMLDRPGKGSPRSGCSRRASHRRRRRPRRG